MKCRNCGAELEENVKFCPFCGTPQQDESLNKREDETDDAKASAKDPSLGAPDSAGVVETNADEPSGKEPSDQRQNKDGVVGGQSIKQLIWFLAKWLGIYAAVFAVVFVAAVATGVAFGLVSPLCYRLEELLSILLACAIPYVVIIVVLLIVGKARRDRARAAVKKVVDANPVAFKACAAVGAIALLAMLFVLTSCPHSEWISATCTEPKTCSACGKTEGDPLGHDWSEATCTSPKTCSRCGVTDGKALGHDLGEWKHVIDYANASSEDIQKCNRCGETVDTKNEAEVTSFVGDGKFTIPAQDFCKRLESKITSYSGYESLNVDLDLSSSGTGADLKIKKGSRTIGLGGFYSDSSTQILYAMTQSENAYFNVVIYLGSDSSNYLAVTLVSLIETADPTLSSDEAKEIAKTCIEEPVERNGVTYAATKSGGYWLSARIE